MTKPTKWHVCPVQIQISLGICPVWSVFAAYMKKVWILSLVTHWLHSEDWSNWADARPIWIFAGCTCHFVSFVMRWLIWSMSSQKTSLSIAKCKGSDHSTHHLHSLIFCLYWNILQQPMILPAYNRGPDQTVHLDLGVSAYAGRHIFAYYGSNKWFPYSMLHIPNSSQCISHLIQIFPTYHIPLKSTLNIRLRKSMINPIWTFQAKLRWS